MYTDAFLICLKLSLCVFFQRKFNRRFIYRVLQSCDFDQIYYFGNEYRFGRRLTLLDHAQSRTVD